MLKEAKMARLAVLFMLSFLLFTFSDARFLTVEPDHDVKSEETVTDLPESNPKTTNTVFLPNEKPGVEPVKGVEIKHDDHNSEGRSDVESVPLTMISFHPINRHFPRHNCPFHKRFRLLNPRFHQKRFISYGNDMILSDERPRFHPDPRGVVRQIQARWARFPDDFMKLRHHDHQHEHDHDHDHDDDHHQDDDDHHHFHHKRHRHHHHEEEEEKNERVEHEHDRVGKFMKKIRKFLDIHF